MPPIPTYDKPVLAGVPPIPLGDGRYSPPPFAGGDPVLDDLQAKLGGVESELNALRDKRAVAVREREEAKKVFAATDGYDTTSPQYKAAEAAVKNVADIDGEIEQVQAAQVGILKMLGKEPPAANGNGHRGASGADSEVVKQLTGEPGRLLATILARRKGDISTLPAEIRLKAAPTVLTTAQVSTVSETEAIIDLLSPMSVAMRSGIQSYKIDTTSTKIPRFTDAPVADWIAELGAFPKNAPGLELLDVKPPKVGLVSPLSVEVFEDLTPMALSLVQNQILRAVAVAYDKGILFGTGTAPQPRGIANTTGILTVGPLPLTNLAAFAQAIAALVGTNAFPGALAINPVDLGTMLSLTEYTSASSNVPLWQDAIRRAADGTYALRLPYFGVPVWPTPAAPQGTALLYDPATVIAVLRREADIAVDPYYDFDHGEIGLRTYLRGDVVVGQPKGAVKITFSP